MFIAGLGIGPSFAVFTIVVQNAAAPRMLGAATSALTFFRQVGGSVGLAIAGTIFGTQLTEQIPAQLGANGVPQPLIDGFSQSSGSMNGELTAVGVDLGAQILAGVPEAMRPAVEPFIGAIVGGIHEAFSIAIANAMWLAVAGALGAALIVAILVPEVTLRRSSGDAGGGEVAERRPSIVPAIE
jgi:hypothetical protein